MLPFALKAVWFCLAFSGIIPCWVVLYTFARAIDCYWLLSYAVFATSLEGIFCLGMIYEMDPFKMPKVFCVVQTFVIYYSAWSLTGICAAFTFATAGSVLWPPVGTCSAHTTVAWRNKYYIPIVVFPLVCLSISVPVLLSIDAIQPTDDLHCDASHPEWGRFLGYAGFSMILTIPCFILSTIAARRIVQMHRNSQRSRWSLRKNRSSRLRSKSQQSSQQNAAMEKASSSFVLSPGPRLLTPESPLSLRSVQSVQPSSVGTDALLCIDYDVSSSATLDLPPSSTRRPEPLEVMAIEEVSCGVDSVGQIADMTISSIALDMPPPSPNLAPAIWRLTLLQMVFFMIQWLAALSTIIDVVRGRPTPTPFGSQHVALVLAGWGPAVVLAHLPSV